MTESAWLKCTDPAEMLHFLHGNTSERKLRLFAVACCRRIWRLLDEPSRKEVDLAERFANGLAAKEEMPSPWSLERGPEEPSSPDDWGKIRAIWSARDAAKLAATLARDGVELEHYAGQVAFYATGAVAWEIAGAAKDSAEAETWSKRWSPVEAGEYKDHAALLRDIIGTPSHPISINPAWLTSSVTTLATIAYEQRSLSPGELNRESLTVLSDALKEAGCNNEVILNHLRGPGPHVRGCWVIDLLLGKE